MSARDVIARALFEFSGSGQGVDDILAEIAHAQTETIITALTAAGIRLAGPEDRVIGKGELDPVTLDRVLEVVNEIAARGYSAAYRGGAMDCDAAIRNLGEKA